MYKFLVIFILLGSFSAFAQQNDKQQILTDSQSFIKALEDKNYEHFMDLMYPTIFDYVDREMFISVLKQAYEGNDEYKFDVINSEDIKFQVSDIFTDIPETKYAFVSYELITELTFLNDSFEDENKRDLLRNSMKLNGYEVEFLDNQTIQTKAQSMLIAINDTATQNQWRYLNHEDNPNRSLFVPAKILKNAKDYYFDLQLK